MATPNAGISCSPLSLKPCCCLLSLASPHHTRRLQQESSTTAEGMRLQKVEQGNLISNWRKAALHSQKPHCVHILCRSWIQTEDEDSIIVLPQQTFQEPSTKGLTGDWNSNMLYSTQRGISPIQWLLSMAYLTPAEDPRERTGESDLC